MFDYFRRLFSEDALAPHGICLLWRPELVWTHVVSDAIIGLAYLSIPLALATFVRRRRDIPYGWMFWCFVAFIVACGLTHFFAIWTLWNPDYGPEALLKAFTALVSIATAIALWRLLPLALAIPSPEQLRLANESLTLRVAERDAAIAAMERANEEREKAEAQLRQLQKMEAVGQLTGGIAHDFNNLLTVVIANLDRAKRLLPAAASDVDRALSGALAGAERAAALTDRLLAFARKQPLQPERQDLKALIEGLRELCERTLGADVRLETEIAPDVGAVNVDANQAENALLNLLVNARDAMPGGGTVTIAARNARPDDTGAELYGRAHVMIEVRDTGAGMDKETVERAFEPFYTTKAVGEGSGLGLSQVYGFAKQSGGWASIVSAPGEGTRVRLFLPRVDA